VRSAVVRELCVVAAMFCPFCKAPRDGLSLLRHCFEKHDGYVPVIVKLTDVLMISEVVRLLNHSGVPVEFPTEDDMPLVKGRAARGSDAR
jgi:hypothetical protein